MSFEPCIAEAQAWAKQHSELKLRAAEIEELGRLLETANARGATAAEKMSLMQDAVMKRIQWQQQAQAGEKALNSIKHIQNFDNIRKNIEFWDRKEVRANSPGDALEAHITGESSRPGIAVNNDPLAASRGNQTQFMGYLENAMTPQELKLSKAMKASDELDRLTRQEMAAIRDKTPEGKTGSEMALSLAKKYTVAGDAQFKEVQAVNPYLKENALYLGSRSHNRELISKVPMAEWVADAKAAYGTSFIGTPERVNSIFEGIYKEIKAGLPPEGVDHTPRFWEPSGTGGSQALQSAGHRVFIATSADAESAYAAKYGDSLYNAYAKNAQRNADYLATVNKWGTKSADQFKRLFDATYKSLDDPAQKADLLSREGALKEKFDATQAYRGNVAWSLTGRFTQGLMSWENSTMLGNHSIRGLNSGAIVMSQIRDGYGLNLFERAQTFAQSAARLMGNFGDAGARELQEMGVRPISVAHDMANQLAAGSGQKIGAAAKLSRLVGKVTLADWTTNAWKFIETDQDSRLLASNAGKSFDSLHPMLQEMLNRYDLGGNKWEVLRNAVDARGRMTPDALKNVPPEAMNLLNAKGLKGQDMLRLKGELAQNLGTLLNERASMAVGESNSASRAVAYGTSDLNSGDNRVAAFAAARNFFMQFKQVAITRQQFLARTLRSGGGDTSNISGTIEYALTAAFAAAVGQEIIHLGKTGRTQNLKDPAVWSHMVSSTGLGGYWSDMLADYLTAPSPFKAKSLLEGDFIGPSFGQVEKGALALRHLGSGAIDHAEGRQGRDQLGGKEWAELLHSVTPFQNVPFVSGALNYHVFNHVHEFLGDTGYVGTLRKQMQQSKDLFGEHGKSLFDE